ncbi:MAG: hypothetical protein LBT46_12630 [Planctomycetaceae bacterium]|jgi:hypothetical protein|nr:hypothetical protein [Planctomycetaceae bacterium]
MFKQVEEEVEYHIYETVEGNRKKRMTTLDRTEAEFWYAEGKIVYEQRKSATQTDWLVTTQEFLYEWH